MTSKCVTPKVGIAEHGPLRLTLALLSWPGERGACFGRPGHLRIIGWCADGRDTHSAAVGRNRTAKGVVSSRIALEPRHHLAAKQERILTQMQADQTGFTQMDRGGRTDIAHKRLPAPRPSACSACIRFHLR